MEDRTLPRIGSIYGLTCSCEPNHIRYVGRTTDTIENRLRGHLKQANAKRHHTPKLTWMRKHLACGHQIFTRLIDDTAVSRDELDALEVFAMWACRRNGHELTNSSVRAGMVEPYSVETRRKMSERATGRPASKEALVKRALWRDTSAGREALSRGGRVAGIKGAKAAGQRLAELSRTPEARARASKQGKINAWALIEWGRSPEGKLGASRAGKIGTHKRWHVNRNMPNPSCEFCSSADLARTD